MSPSDRPTDLSTFRLRKRTPGCFILVPCPRENRSIRCQGRLEGATATILAACARVTAVNEQPFEIWYAWRPTPGGCQIRLLAERPAQGPRKSLPFRVSYIVPDFLIRMDDDRQYLLEVKPSHKLCSPVTRRKLAVTALYAASHGKQFVVLTEKEIHQGSLLANLRLLRRYRHLAAEPKVADELARHVSARGVGFADLLRFGHSCGSDLLLRAHVLHLLGSGALSFDPTVHPLGPDTLLFPGGTFVWDPFASLWAPNGCLTGGPTGWSGSSPPIGSSPST